MLDVWVEELRPVIKEEDDEVVGERLMDPVRTLEKEARGKTVRKRAGETMREWERRETEVENDAEAGSDVVKKDDGTENNEEGWEGFEG